MGARPVLLASLLLGALLAGCASNAPPEAPRAGLAPRPCEHPWPCGDGSEWPKDLVPSAGPLEIPADFAPAGAEVVGRTAKSVTLRWRVPTVDAYDVTASLGLVLPIVAGTLGGRAPDVEYPPRPFAPETT